MSQPERSDIEVTLPQLVAALIGRKLRDAGFEATWAGGEVRATHQSGDKLLIWVQEVD